MVSWRHLVLAVATGCCGAGLLALTVSAFAYALVQQTYFRPYQGDKKVAMMPGNAQRLRVQGAVVRALRTGNWTAVEQGLTENNMALMISDRSGPRWETSRGWINLDDQYAVASQSKVITALAIYRLIQRNSSLLSPSTKASRYIKSWPRPPAEGSGVTLSDLLSFTTGFGLLNFHRPGCPKQAHRGPKQPSWAECVDEIAKHDFKFPPGTTLQYGPWHMVVAAAMAMLAFGRELTTESWIRTVREEVFEPSGLTGAPDYSGAQSDVPFRARVGSFPDFSGGMRLSGRQWQRIIQSLHYGSLLRPEVFEEFTRDHTTNATRLVGRLATDSFASVGMWHYAQGEWIACDAAAAHGLVGMPAQNSLCGGRDGKPAPRVLHSVGAWGCYVWMDLTNDYNGVFVHSMIWDLLVCFGITVAVNVVATPVAGCACGFLALRRLGRKAEAGKAASGKVTPTTCGADEEHVGLRDSIDERQCATRRESDEDASLEGGRAEGGAGNAPGTSSHSLSRGRSDST